MRRYERSIDVRRPPEAVFDYFADMRHIPEWAAEDFVSVTRVNDGPIGRGTRFAYVTRGARAASWFAWDTFERPCELVFSGPRVNVGPGWVEGLGGYRFEPTADGTRASVWLQPTLGGLLALMSPVARMRNVRVLTHQLARVKDILERQALTVPIEGGDWSFVSRVPNL
jgi:uncharacterized protein YndB with AHSA1/START domain